MTPTLLFLLRGMALLVWRGIVLPRLCLLSCVLVVCSGGGAAGMWYLGRQGDQSPLANSVQVVVDSSPSRAPFRATAPMPFTIDEPAMYASPRSNAGRAQEEHERLTPGSVHGGVAMSENGRPTFTMNAPNVRIDDVGVSLMQQRRRSLADAAAADTTSHKKHSTGEDTHVIAVIEKVRRRRRSSVVAGVTRAAPASSDDEEAKLMEQPDPMLEYEDALRNVGQRQVLQEEWVKHHMKERRGFTSPLIEAEMALHRYRLQARLMSLCVTLCSCRLFVFFLSVQCHDVHGRARARAAKHCVYSRGV